MTSPKRIDSKARALYKEAIRKALPNASIRRLRFVEIGWQCIVVVADNAIVFRFPRARENVSDMEMELRLLPLLARHLPCPIPVPLQVRPPLAADGMPFMTYKIVPGKRTNWRAFTPRERAMFLGDLGRVLDALAEFPIGCALSAGVEDHRSPAWMLEFRHYYERSFNKDVSPFLKKDLRSKLQRTFREYLGNPRNADFRPVLLHRELDPGHVLVSSGRMSGIIDWGAAWVGDPAYDIGQVDSALTLTDTDVERLGKERIGPKDLTFNDRVRFYKRFDAISKLHGAIRRNDQAVFGSAIRLLEKL